MNYGNLVVAGAILFIILISMQYSLNKMIVLLKEIKGILHRMEKN
ncbi:hypothetical protein SAMN05446037_103829 [Anaerovirgula multivorans]|uniref:Uncharacterized protein n=1 Tax=Anaerovirgula multivorans TaxID=312168 RepID=A0A239JR61_9FIRM|nr:hypothetical protein [Anaerovirgula multivorans]SNT08536.1 hypothetical protein SAMN05446037_103829 [Anaerovirgula multivorans]